MFAELTALDLALVFGTIGVLVVMPIVIIGWAMTRLGSAATD